MIEQALSCSVLGAVRVEVDARVVKIAAPRQRALLAMLLLDINRTVSSSRLFDAALACWTGEPLADVASFPFHDGAARRLREFQLGLVESRNVAYLRCGRHLDVLPDVGTWIEANPWRERLRAQQMVALFRSGR